MNRLTGRILPLIAAILSLGAVGMARPADDFMLPPDAKPGECYARVFVPPVYKTDTERILIKSSSERIEAMPAQYGWDEQRVLVKGASERLEVVPATYEWQEEQVLVKPASKRIEEVPAVWETVTEQILDRPAHTVWKKGRGPLEIVDNSTGEIMCLIEVPATYKTVTKKELKSPATTREIEIPAEYKTVRKHVMKTPPSTRTVTIPAEYDTVRVRTLVSPASTRSIPIPEEYTTVTKTSKVKEGYMQWRQVLCETNLTRNAVRSIQLRLKAGGYYDGPIDGILGSGTLSGLRSFQKAENLPAGEMTMESIRKLGVDLNE